MASQRGALAVAFLSLFAQGSLGAAKFDRVKSLPGWDAPLKSKTYSGLMHAGKSCVDGGCYSMEMHYVFIESERDPWTDPVVLWTNGGPGAASLFGLFVELGPYKLSDLSLNTKKYNATGVPTLFENPYSWTSFANLLIINGPAPVGFSFCNPPGPMGNGTSCGSWNDTRTAHHNLKFLQSFFKAYPEFSNNDFYLTVDVDRVQTLVEGFGSYSAAAGGAGLLGDRSREQVVEEVADKVSELLLSPRSTPLQQIVLEQIAKVVGASSRAAWQRVREASGRDREGRSLVGRLVDPLGLFARSSLVNVNHEDQKALESTVKLVALLRQASFGNELAQMSQEEVRSLSRIVIRKLWDRRRELFLTSNRLGLELLKQTAERLDRSPSTASRAPARIEAKK